MGHDYDFKVKCFVIYSDVIDWEILNQDGITSDFWYFIVLDDANCLYYQGRFWGEKRLEE